MPRLKVKTKKTEDSYSNTIGGMLRKARENKGISVEEAHKTTKIHPNVIRAIEEDNLENIPGGAYVKAFIKNYAQYLGMNEKDILREYSSRYPGAAENKPALVLKHKAAIESAPKNYKHIILAVFAFLIWILVLIFVTFRFFHSGRSILSFKKPQTAKIENAPAETVRVAAQQVVITTPIQHELLNKGGRPLITIPKSRTLSVTVSSSKDVWIKVVRDGELAYHGILKKDSVETWKADDEIRLSEIGRPEAIGISVNGKDINLPKKNPSKNILITKKGIDLGARQ